MTVDTIYEAYLEETGIRTADGLNEKMDQALDLIRDIGADLSTIQTAEETINRMLDLQERQAFHAGFRAAFELMGSTVLGN